jgi:hypothetical protein
MMKQSFVLLFGSVNAFWCAPYGANGFNFFKPSSTQVKHAQQRSRERKPQPVAPPPPPVLEDESNNLSMPEIPALPQDFNPISPGAWNSITSAALRFATKFAPKAIQEKSDRAARVQINRLPPNSIEVDLNDVPIVGPAVSGTYAKIKKDRVPNPSIVIASPKDKLGAVQGASADGKFEFNLNGLLQTFLDIQLEPNKPGVAPVKLQSPLIPKWPFGKRKSDWYKVSNCGNGESYYFNEKTGETSFDEPKDSYKD